MSSPREVVLNSVRVSGVSFLGINSSSEVHPTYRDTNLAKLKDTMHRNAYAILIREAVRLNMFEDSRFCKDILRIITVIA